MSCLKHSNDIFQSGGECLRAYMSVSPEQLCTYSDSEGKTGLFFMVNVANHLLNPGGSEFTATFVGKLITTLIQKAGDKLEANLDMLLKAVLSKLQGSKTLSVIQVLATRPSLLSIHLENYQFSFFFYRV